MKALFRILCLVSTVVAMALGGSFSLTVERDTRRVIDLGTFAYSSRGVLRITVKTFAVDAAGLKNSSEPIGFVLNPVVNAQFGRIEKNYGSGDEASRRVCFIEDPEVLPKDPAQRKLLPMENKVGQSFSEPLLQERTVSTPGFYALFFYNCKGYNMKSSSNPVPVTFSVNVEQFSYTTNGKTTYLSIGNTPLPTVYLFFSVVFTVMVVLWVVQCRQQAMHRHKIHSVMAVLIALKAATLFFDSMKYRAHEQAGGVSAWDVFYYAFLTLKGMMLFSVLLLLGSGWSVLKAFLSEQDKRILMILIPCQVIINVAIAVMDETSEGNRNWTTWRDLLRILDIICCCCVLLPIVWSIKNLRDAASQDGKAARNLSRLRIFRTFYVIVVAYIYFTRIVLVMVDSSLPYNLTYVTPVLRETVAALFYAYTGYKFRPMPENPYFNLASDEVEEMDRTEIGEEDEVPHAKASHREK